MKRLLALAVIMTGCTTGTWQLQENNDFFKPIGNNDEKYTQGLRLSNIREDDTGSHVYYFGQSIYTPSDKQTEDYLPNQRPYSGYLYAGYDARYVRSPNVQDTLGVNVGMVGPASLAGQAQNTVHRLIGQKTAKGWDNQIHNEPGVILKAERKYYEPITSWMDSTTSIGGDIGNVFTQAYTTFGIRLGHNLAPFFDSASPVFPRIRKQGTSVYLFCEGVERAVGRNIFLDGNTFRKSASIDKKTFVLEGRLGIAVEFDGYAVRYTYIAQSEEFEGEGAGADFGEVSISW
jgi:lipid A 3-O-deacylase